MKTLIRNLRYLPLIIFVGLSQSALSQFSDDGIDYIRHSLLQITQGSTGRTFNFSWNKAKITELLGTPLEVKHDELYDDGDFDRFDKYEYEDLWLWFDGDRLSGFDIFGSSIVFVDDHFSLN